MKEQKFISKELRAHKLYANKNIFKTVLIVAIPGLLISLMSGIYVFADQLLLTTLVPKDPYHDFLHIYSSGNFHPPYGEELENYIIRLLEKLNTDLGSNYSLMDTASIVKSAVAITCPIMNIINAVPNIAAVGAGTLYGQCIAKNNKDKANQIWKTTFYCAIFIGLLSSFVFASINNALLSSLAGNQIVIEPGKTTLTDQELSDINEYFKIGRATQIAWSHEFLDILCWSSILNVFILYFSFMVRAEGKLLFITTAEVGCNILNVIFDWIYISFAHAGMMGGGLATLTGWSVNVIVYATYILYLSRKNQTWMKYRILLPQSPVKISFTILVPVIILGISVFLRNLANNIANAVFISKLADVADHVPSQGGGQYWQELSGAVWPITSLFFYAIFGIADGVRGFVAYNYARSKFQRIRTIYWYSILVSFMYAIIVYVSLATFMGTWLIKLFDLPQSTQGDMRNYLTIQALFIPMVSLTIGGLLIFQATNQMWLANIVALIQGCLTFPIASSIMYAIAVQNQNTYIFVGTNPLNTSMAGIIVQTISITYLYKFLGKIRYTIRFFDHDKNKLIKEKICIPSTFKKMSYAEKQLENFN